jgi:hypothetical protein
MTDPATAAPNPAVPALLDSARLPHAPTTRCLPASLRW